MSVRYAGNNKPVIRPSAHTSRATLIVDLPAKVTRTIFTDWLAMKDTCRTDSAFCISRLRIAFINVAYRTAEYGIHQYSHSANLNFDKVARWSIMRRAMVSSVMLSPDRNLLQQFLQGSGASVRYVIYRALPTQKDKNLNAALQEVNKWCTNVEDYQVVCNGKTLNQSNRSYDCFLSELTERNKNIRSLTLQSVSSNTAVLASAVGSLTSLVRLTLHRCSCVLPVELARPTLTEIDIRFNSVPDNLISAIGSNCALLRVLYVFEGTNASQKRGPQAATFGVVLDGCPLLRAIDIERTEDLDFDLRVAFAKRCGMTIDTKRPCKQDNSKLLKGLGISATETSLSCVTGGTVSDAILAVCAEMYPLLEAVHIAHKQTFTTVGFAALTGPGNRLCEISFKSCKCVTTEVLTLIATSCPHLRKVRVTNCRNVDDQGIIAIAGPGSMLEDVSLESLGITDASLIVLGTHCLHLRSVELLSCSEVTKKGVRALTHVPTARWNVCTSTTVYPTCCWGTPRCSPSPSTARCCVNWMAATA
jgi:hypothetical protein